MRAFKTAHFAVKNVLQTPLTHLRNSCRNVWSRHMGYLETECLAKNVLLHYSQMRLLFDMTIPILAKRGYRRQCVPPPEIN